MFTGIVEELGTIAAVESVDADGRAAGPGGTARLVVTCHDVVTDAATGDSINTNGCCLTVTELTGDGFAADLMGETLDRTGLGVLRTGSPVNLERALRADGRLGGHLVSGHVDATARVTAVEDRGDWTVMRFTLPDAVARYLVEKGSVTVDGTSLTVMEVTGHDFAVGLIPHTLAVTVLGRRDVGDVVNLEADMIAKYTERLLSGGVTSPYRPA